MSGAAGAPSGADGLAERCRALWSQGDWQSLAAYGADDLQTHPQRASLALMVAAAHQAQNRDAQTRSFVDLARRWGCEPQLIARALLAGVHNTLGRASVAARRGDSQALQHFADAMAPGGAAGSATTALHERVRHQLNDMRLESEVPWLLGGATQRSAPAAPAQPRVDADALRRASDLTLLRLKEQSQQLASVRRSIEATVRKEMANAVAQLEAYASLQRYLNGGQLLPELHGWPVSPDFAVMLIDMVESNDYDLIIEFGSGTSTLLMALALARAAQRHRRSVAAVQLAFEHLEFFFAQTRSRLERADVAHAVQLELAELKTWTSANGTPYDFYDCQGKLEAAVRAAPEPVRRALVVVDGPPAATGPQARYPALPIVLPLLKDVAADILLDDHGRPEEQQISKMWLAELEAAGRRASVSYPSLEKGACLLKLDAG
ncbi:MAG TPA: hypothetical protein PKB14_11955 [Rubrivivax sp.]|nr:hypothetical protein [Rubrivivax sp.]